MQRTGITQQRSMRSVYSRQELPPIEAPEGIQEVTAWHLAAGQWRDHLPDDLLGVECVICQVKWPCFAWNIANDVLNSCHATADQES
ncbi:MAG TPA: hypothetical protein H9902_02320 [Candidatus Stackebrandtia faecavium]|nr:hypothetical protein [Candidatus Stackebrandtia faecavium]